MYFSANTFLYVLSCIILLEVWERTYPPVSFEGKIKLGDRLEGKRNRFWFQESSIGP